MEHNSSCLIQVESPVAYFYYKILIPSFNEQESMHREWEKWYKYDEWKIDTSGQNYPV